jgi:hypothetical protein
MKAGGIWFNVKGVLRSTPAWQAYLRWQERRGCKTCR